MDLQEFKKLETERVANKQSVITLLSSQPELTQYMYYKLKRELSLEDGLSGNFIPLNINGVDRHSTSTGVYTGSSANKRVKQSKNIILSAVEIQMRTPTGTELRITGELSIEALSAIIQSSGGVKGV